MPKYAYRCNECENEFQIYHSMNDKLKDCESCELTGSLVRIPSLTTRVHKNTDNNTKVGEVVKSHIEDAKQQLKKEKEKLKKITYKPKK
jgi:putative FmdB family regulatory protein